MDEKTHESMEVFIKDLCCSIESIANSVTPLDAAGYKTDGGATVNSLTEAIILAAEGLWDISGAIKQLAYAVERIANKGE